MLPTDPSVKINESARKWDRARATMQTVHGLRLSLADDAEYQTQYDAAAARRDAAKAQGNQTLAKHYRQQISALYAKYAAKQLPEVDELEPPSLPTSEKQPPQSPFAKVLGRLAALEAWENAADPLAPTLNTDRTVAVSKEVYWIEDMTACPRGCKVQLLGAGGVAVYSMYDGKDPFWVGWQAVPRRRVKP